MQSLTLIEPGCYQAAADDPVVAAALAANKEGHAKLPMDLPAEVYLRAATDSAGLPPLPATPQRLRAAATALREMPCWEAPIPMEALGRRHGPSWSSMAHGKTRPTCTSPGAAYRWSRVPVSPPNGLARACSRSPVLTTIRTPTALSR